MKTFFATVKKAKPRYRTMILPFLFATILAAVGAVVMNLLSGQISEAAVAMELDTIFRLIALMTGVFVLRAGASAASIVLSARFSAGTGYRLRKLFVDHFLRAPFSVIEKTPSGERLNIYSNDIPNAESLIASGLLGIVADFISFASAFLFLIYISPQHTGILILASIGMVVVQGLISIPLNKVSVKISEDFAKVTAVANDSLQNLSVVAAYSLEDVVVKRYEERYNVFFARLKRMAVILAVTIGFMLTLMFSPLVVVVTVLGLATIDGNMTLAEFIAFTTTITMVAGGLTMIGQRVAGIAQSAAGAKRLMDATADKIEKLEDGESADSAAVAISFRDVVFAYGEVKPGAESEEEVSPVSPALNGVSFDIAPGSRVAIVGGSGSGKSTILKLLFGLYEPTGGEILLNGKNAAVFSKNNLRNMFAYVPQDSFLFPESIGKNITLEDSVTDMPRLEKACADAEILDFVNSLPDRFDGVLTEAADNVSGGQRQRIAMARAFYKNAPVILFDEATSSLDQATEAAVLGKIGSAAAGKTVIIVAHRATAVAACDTIIVLEGGNVSGVGRHDELLAVNEVYRGLYDTGVPI